MDKIKVGDIFQIGYLGKKETVAVIAVYRKQVVILFKTGNVDELDCSVFLKSWHKIGHIEKFAEALKELQEITKNP